MRGLATGERSLLTGSAVSTKARVEVRDSDGTWRNISSMFGYDFFHSADWGGNPDDQVQSATITLRRRAGAYSMAPLMGGSPINRDAASNYVPFVREGSPVRLYTATGLPGFTPGSNANNSWHKVFEGKIDEVDSAASKSTIALRCRDIGAILQTLWIETAATYGSAFPGTAIETVMQQILTTWAPGWTLVTVGTPLAGVKTYTQARMSVMDALTALAQQIGWVVRCEWGAGDTFELRLFKPAVKGSDDMVLAPTEYFSIQELKTSDADIRNVVSVKGVDASSNDIEQTATNSASITTYGRHFMEIQESSTSALNTNAELLRLAQAAVDDLSTPYASHRIETRYLWPIERGDRHTYVANGVHYDSDQTLYVSEFRHNLSNGKARTVITARGKPVARYRAWFPFAERGSSLAENSLLDVVATEFPTTYSIAWGGLGTISLSIDGGAWVTPPPSSPIVVTRNRENGATKLYRFRSVLEEDITYETIWVLPIGAVAPPPDLSVVPSTPLTLTQSYTVTCTNPRSGGATPIITVFSVGASGVATKPDTTTVAITDGASPVVVPTGTVVAMTRPAFGNGAGSVVFRGAITGGGLAEIQRTVTPRQAIGPNLTVTPTPFTSTYSIAWSGDGVTLSIDGGAFAAPGASPIIVNRPAVGAADKVYTFKGTLDGQTVTNTVTIPAIDSPETPNLTVSLSSQTDTQYVFNVTAASPTGGATPAIVGYLSDATFADGHTDGGAITSGTTVTINRPAFGNKRDGLFRVRATASGGTAYEEITWNIAPIVQTSFGPSLTVTPTPFASTYALYYAGDSVQVDKRDGSGFVSPGGSPLIVTRPAIGNPDLVYTFRATKDGQEVTNSVTIPSVGSGYETPNLNVTPQTPTSTQQGFTVTASAPSGSTPTINVYFTGCTSSTHSDGAPVTSGSTVTVNKPTFGNVAGSVRFRAALGSEFEEISRTIVTQIKTTFGPTLNLRTYQPNLTQYTFYWDDNGSGSTIEVNKNAAGWSAPGASPWTVNRPAASSADDVYAWRATKDGQSISDSIIVPAIGKLAPSMDVAVVESATSVSISWNDLGYTSVSYYSDSGGPFTPSNPLVIMRNAPGGAAKNITLRGEHDGIIFVNTVIVGPQVPDKFTSATSSTFYDTGGTNRQYGTANWAVSSSVDDSTYTVDVDFMKNGVRYDKVSGVTPSDGTVTGSGASIAAPVSTDKFHAVLYLKRSGSIIDTKTTKQLTQSGT